MFDLNKNEDEVIEYWKEHGINAKVKERNKEGKKFYFLDGPPYATGELHPGQIWVKTIKDIFLRYRRFKGYDVHDRAGYDVHGLPVEHKVESSLKLGSKREIESRIGVENFIKDCKAYVDSLIPRMGADYKRFGISMDFDSAYIPYTRQYIENAWKMLKSAHGKGLLYADLKPMLYCVHCETVLAQGTLEVEYADDKDTAVFVAFRVDDKFSKARIQVDSQTYLVIWTTTPWTLPSNMAIAVNPKEIYVKAESNGRKLIIMKKRLDAVLGSIGESAVVEAEFYGSELEGIFYVSPLESKVPKQKEFRKYHRIVFSEEGVSTEEGSGLVHIAPGHGFDDYNIGKKNGIPAFSPLDAHAAYTTDAGEYAGIKAPDDANVRIVSDLEALGFLLDRGSVTHSYPHCWRCSGKLIYVVTKQWFLNISKIKSKLIKENRKVSWHPAEAMGWQEEVLKNSPDWCISRQRYWGIPIPIWSCTECEEWEAIGSVGELVEKSGDKNVAESLVDLHRPYIDRVGIRCGKCGGDSRRVSDVFDVWFDSGIAFMASLSSDDFARLFPADFILEGKDQLRGWFSTLLKSSVMVYGEKPFNNVVLDGMLIGEDGREMHKHLGNYISLGELLEFTSADAFRLWCSGHTQWLDLQFKREEVKEAEKTIGVMYNIFNLIEEYSSSSGYTARKIRKPIASSSTSLEDIWILSRFNTVVKAATEALENYEASVANGILIGFLINDVSRFYLKMAKKKILFREKVDSRKQLDLLNYMLYNLLVLFAPFSPFTSERLYLDNYRSKYEGMEESVLLNRWPSHSQKNINTNVEEDMKIAIDAVTALLSSREKARIKLRQPLARATLEVKDGAIQSTLQKFAYIIEEYTNVRHLDVTKVDAFEKEVRPIFAKIGPEFRENSSTVADALREANADDVLNGISSQGRYDLHTPRGVFGIREDHFTVVEKLRRENSTQFRHGIAYIDTEIDAGLLQEALVREFERRIQLIRKEMHLKKPDKIRLYYTAAGDMMEVIEKNREKIMSDINAETLSSGIAEGTEVKEFDIDGEVARVFVERLPS